MTALEFTHQLASLRSTLYTFTRRFTQDRDESLDLVQDTLLKALTYRDKFRDQTNLHGWLFTIMRNTFINKYRKIKRSKILRSSSTDMFTLNVADTHTFNKPETTYEYNDIWKQVNTLPEGLLQPFTLHTHGYKYHEIAEKLTLPVGTVKNRIFHARKEIQKKLTGY